MARCWGVRSKIWLEYEGRPVIGEGREKMLRAIYEHGSIKQAALEIGISYRRMRGALREMEEIIGYPLVSVHRGGGAGGGAELTSEAHALLEAFEQLNTGFQEAADARFNGMPNIFSSPNGKNRHSVENGKETP